MVAVEIIAQSSIIEIWMLHVNQMISYKFIRQFE